jgi:hypothetical protein
MDESTRDIANVHCDTITNRYVDELRELESSLARTRPQQRRGCFEQQLQAVRVRWSRAQVNLPSSGGLDPGESKCEATAGSESYAPLPARVIEAEVHLRGLKQGRADPAPEVTRQVTLLETHRQPSDRPEHLNVDQRNADQLSHHSQFKYQAPPFDQFARQIDSAPIAESPECALIPIIALTSPAERRTSTKRASTAVVATAAAMFSLVVFVLVRQAWQLAVATQRGSSAHHRLHLVLGRPGATR